MTDDGDDADNGGATYVMQPMWCGATYVVHPTWCNLCGATNVPMPHMRCNICGYIEAKEGGELL